MQSSPQPTYEERVADIKASDARQTTWRIAAALLIGLVMLNVVMVIYTRSPFSAWFAITNGINLILALALGQLRPWARYLTILRVLLGVLLAFVGIVQGATIDFIVTTLLLVGIALPLIGPPKMAKNIVGILLFVAGLFVSMAAVITQLVVVG